MVDNWEAMRHARLLLVNDDGVLQEIAASLFRREAPDITIDAALDGDEALELYKGESYDVVLTDLVHPGMNGVELAQGERNPKQQLVRHFFALSGDFERNRDLSTIIECGDRFLWLVKVMIRIANGAYWVACSVCIRSDNT